MLRNWDQNRINSYSLFFEHEDRETEGFWWHCNLPLQGYNIPHWTWTCFCRALFVIVAWPFFLILWDNLPCALVERGHDWPSATEVTWINTGKTRLWQITTKHNNVRTAGKIHGMYSLIARFMGSTWGHLGRQDPGGPMLAPWTSLSGLSSKGSPRSRFVFPFTWRQQEGWQWTLHSG